MMFVLFLRQVIGDPLECAVFEKTGFKLSGEKSSQLAAKKLSVEMVYCYHFSAQLRRMTTVAIVSVAASRPEYRVCVKVKTTLSFFKCFCFFCFFCFFDVGCSRSGSFTSAF
jgi:magnesium-transporting ATPase (P-type)